ncbi:hypothetical protein NQ318_004016, partial [Aromia moschata]
MYQVCQFRSPKMLPGGKVTVNNWKLLSIEKNITFSILFTIGTSLIFCYLHYSDFSIFSETLSMIITMIAYLCKLTNFISQSGTLVELERILDNPIFTSVSKDEEIILKHHTRSLRIITNIYRTLCILTVVFYFTNSFIDSDRQNGLKLPLPAWFPFETRDHYYKVYFLQLVTMIVAVWFNLAMDLLLVKLLALGEAEFEVLKHRLRNITSRDEDEKIGFDHLVEKRLRKCIFHHEHNLRFVALTENVFSLGVLVQFMCSVLVTCLNGFYILVISLKSVQFVQRIVYSSCMLCQIATYCWYGQVLADS